MTMGDGDGALRGLGIVSVITIHIDAGRVVVQKTTIQVVALTGLPRDLREELGSSVTVDIIKHFSHIVIIEVLWC